jgi:serine/threonine-protein kinase RsbW
MPPLPPGRTTARNRLAVECSFASLARVGAAVRNAAKDFGFDDDTCFALDLAIVEAVTNVVKHGAHPPGIKLVIEIMPSFDRLLISLRDHGSPIPAEVLTRAVDGVFDFDPEDPQSAPDHGMGVPLIRNIADELKYESGPDGNLLTLTRYVEGAAGAKPRD